jgi:formylglycine-generating enzyme
MSYEWLLESYERTGDARSFLELARTLEAAGRVHLACTAYDRAFGLLPHDGEIKQSREALLQRLAVREHGITFRYVPAGTFLMGSDAGEPDERPVHPVRLNAFWMSETPISWATYCELLDWQPPPYARPKGAVPGFQVMITRHNKWFFRLLEENKIRMQYCEDATSCATAWYVHATAFAPSDDRAEPRRPPGFELKPMVGISWRDVQTLCDRLTTARSIVRLPTEAEWEKASRGGLLRCSYSWGDDPPNEDRCDYDAFDRFSILPMRRFAPNGYGLFATNGCVWEWTSDWYDAEFYANSTRANPTGPPEGAEKVLRGGSWADCAETVTVSFRMSRRAGSLREGSGGYRAPNIGFRLCRVEPVEY